MMWLALLLLDEMIRGLFLVVPRWLHFLASAGAAYFSWLASDLILRWIECIRKRAKHSARQRNDSELQNESERKVQRSGSHLKI